MKIKQIPLNNIPSKSNPLTIIIQHFPIIIVDQITVAKRMHIIKLIPNLNNKDSNFIHNSSNNNTMRIKITNKVKRKMMMICC